MSVKNALVQKPQDVGPRLGVAAMRHVVYLMRITLINTDFIAIISEISFYFLLSSGIREIR